MEGHVTMARHGCFARARKTATPVLLAIGPLLPFPFLYAFCFGPNSRRSNILILTRRRRRLKQGLLGPVLISLSDCKTFKKYRLLFFIPTD